MAQRTGLPTKERKHRNYLAKKSDYISKGSLRHQHLKQQIFDHYGWICRCCGENNPKFMTLDHINNDGSEQIKRLGIARSGTPFYAYVIKAGFPDDLQTLCYNCNLGKKANGGVCPHVR